ncbi:MAG: hypothetical protein ACLQIQ_07585 [Beijerinckiaceae bacterium]
MTSTTANAATSPHQAARAAASDSLPLWLPILVALALGLVLSLPRTVAVWQTGAFFDSDDAMRLVEVRNLLAGQAWFDMSVYRLDPPAGVFMHWSRVVDVPLVVLIKAFSVFLAPDHAERAARLAFPFALQALLYTGIARLARLLMGRAAVLPAILLTLLSGIAFGQFQPGRIDHHAPQIVLLVFIVGSAVAALDAKQARCAAWAGLLAALSLSISIETLPFILALAGLMILAWVWWGGDARKPLLPFGLGLGLGLAAAFVATIGPAHWFDASCDAFSSAYLLPGLAGALVVAALGLLPKHLDRRLSRMAAAVLGALVVAWVLAAARPICLIDPFVGIDPLLREFWLDKVSEAMPLRRFFQREPYSALIFSLPVLLGLAATAVAARHETGLAQQRWIFVAAMSLVGAALCFWMIRVIGFAGPVALLGGAWCIGKLGALLQTKWAQGAALSLALALPFSSIGWALVLTHEDHKTGADSPGTCLAPQAIAPLDALEPGLFVAPIDAGSYILAFTRHRVVAAPYHRNNHGNRLMLDAFLAEPHSAEVLLRDNHVDYVALCADLKETARLAERAPNGLAAALLRGQIPTFLLPVLPHDADPNSSYRVLKVSHSVHAQRLN